MEDKYQKAKDDRQARVESILNSTSAKKVVVAGPGTGKTHLFKLALKGQQRALTLTFINSLVEDLSLELYGLSEVRTLHSFARSVLGRRVKVHPDIPKIISQDFHLLTEQQIDFDSIFNNRDDQNSNLAFYQARREYYDKHYGYSDIVFSAVRYLEENMDKVPTYDIVVVDEFQDFNKLEISLLDLLSTKNAVLLAGDDDQALYAFKHATPEHIRHRHGEASPDYAGFSLPYCSRCTEVIVDSTNDLILSAVANGHLKGRIDKEYRYFPSEDKDAIGKLYPKIVYAHRYSKQIPYFISEQLAIIAADQRSKFGTLVISPNTIQCRDIGDALARKGFRDVTYREKRSKEPSLLDGLVLLLEEKESNLGWRIAARNLLDDKDFVEVLKNSAKPSAARISELVSHGIKRDVKKMLTTLRAIRDQKDFDKDRLEEITRDTLLAPHSLAERAVMQRIQDAMPTSLSPALRKLPINITTIQNSKGLAEDIVFIANFDDRYFLDDKGRAVTDQNICNFLVALTRARKKVFLVSSSPRDPTFLGWIKPERIERI